MTPDAASILDACRLFQPVTPPQRRCLLQMADEDPAFWEPTSADIERMQQADLILLNGAGYAKWVERATLPASKVADTTAGVSDRLLELAGTVTHSHGPEGEHEHHGWAFTTWLDPTLALDQARAVAAALQARLPGAADEIDEEGAVLIVGFGRTGSVVGRFLRANGVKPIVLDHDSDRVETLRALGLKVVAEGVETEEDHRTLAELGLYIHVAKISTKVDQVADTFYVKDIFKLRISVLIVDRYFK